MKTDNWTGQNSQIIVASTEEEEEEEEEEEDEENFSLGGARIESLIWRSD